MSDSEKRQEFYQWFNPNADEWNVKKSVWKETVAITFDQLLTKGLNYQQELDLRKATADASGVKEFVATTSSSSTSNKRDFSSMTQPTGQQIAEFVARTVGRGRGGRFGGRGRASQAHKAGKGGRGGKGGKGGNTAKFNDKCLYCGIKGHRESDCRKKKRDGNGNNGGGGGASGNIVTLGCMRLVEPLYSPLVVHVCAVLAMLSLLVLFWSGGGKLTSHIGGQLTSLIGGQLSSGTFGTKQTILTSSAVVFGLVLTLREYGKLTASTSISSFIEISCSLLGLGAGSLRDRGFMFLYAWIKKVACRKHSRRWPATISSRTAPSATVSTPA